MPSCKASRAWRPTKSSSSSGNNVLQIALGPPRGVLALSLLGALWSSSSAMTAIIETLNRTYHVREGRPWWRVRLLAVPRLVAGERRTKDMAVPRLRATPAADPAASGARRWGIRIAAVLIVAFVAVVMVSLARR